MSERTSPHVPPRLQACEWPVVSTPTLDVEHGPNGETMGSVNTLDSCLQLQLYADTTRCQVWFDLKPLWALHTKTLRQRLVKLLEECHLQLN